MQQFPVKLCTAVMRKKKHLAARILSILLAGTVSAMYVPQSPHTHSHVHAEETHVHGDAAETEPEEHAFYMVTEEGEGAVNYYYVDEEGNRLPDFNLSPDRGVAASADSVSYYNSCEQGSGGYITSVKNQNPTGTCWAHATLAAAEANLIKKGIATTALDLSESHLVFFSKGRSVQDTGHPLYGDGLDNGISTTYGLDGDGGNVNLTIPALASWTGPVLESSEQAIQATATLEESHRFRSEYHLMNAFLYENDDIRAVKQAIMDNGAVSANYYHDNSYSYYTINENYIACYQNVTDEVTHAICIVGWDDNFSKSNFTSAGSPSANGAWICKNSYGDTWRMDNGDSAEKQGGYFYLSYYDTSVSGFASYDMEAADNYDTLYQYDGDWAGGIHFGATSPITGANIFTAEVDSTLSAVGIRTYDADNPYKIYIYTGVSDTDPSSGTLRTTQEGEFDYAGYHSVQLNESVSLKAGEQFAVVITLQKNGALLAKDSGTNPYMDSLSYYCAGDPTTTDKWKNCQTNYSADLCIKAYASSDILIDAVNFPDAVFRRYITNHFDLDGNGMLSEEEIADATAIHVGESGVTDLTGIAYFTELTLLDCSGNALTTLDLSANTQLTRVFCEDNALTSLNVRSCPILFYLNCGNNQLQTLNLSSNTQLNTLYCDNNPMLGIDLTKNTVLSTFSGNFRRSLGALLCTGFTLSGLDVSRVSDLTGATLSGSKFLPEATTITYRYDCGNDLTASVTLTGESFGHNYGDWVSYGSVNHRKVCSVCGDAPEEPHVFGAWSYNDSSTHIHTCTICGGSPTENHVYGEWQDNGSNHMRYCTAAGCTASQPGTHVYGAWTPSEDGENHYRTCMTCGNVADGSHIYSAWEMTDDGLVRTCAICGFDDTDGGVLLNETNFPDAAFRNFISENYDTDGNAVLTTEELSAVTTMQADDLGITSVKGVEYFIYLRTFTCRYNAITSLDLSKNTQLVVLYCNDNQLTELDLSACPMLSYVLCSNNPLISLDLSYQTNLNTLNCNGCVRALGDAACTDFSALGLDMTRVSDVTGAAVVDGQFVPTSDTITYTYDCGNGFSAVFTLQADSVTHAFGGWEETTGDSVRTCEDCGLTEACAHAYGGWTPSASGGHVQTCTLCGDEKKDDHTYDVFETAGENTHAKTCSLCGDEAPESHTFGEWSTNGESTHIRYCSFCGEDNTDSHVLGEWVQNGEDGHTNTCTVCAQPVENAHDYGGWSATAEDTHKRTCETCQYIDEKPHTYGEWGESGSGLTRTCSVCSNVDVDGGVMINAVNFPDGAFRMEISALFDTDGNGVLVAEEIAAVKTMQISDLGITDLTGIRYFTELDFLDCQSNAITALDLSSNTKLTALYCQENALTSLNVSSCTALEYLNCDNNQLMSLDVSMMPGLRLLSCVNNPMVCLDLTNNTAMTYFSGGFIREIGDLTCTGFTLEGPDPDRMTNLTNATLENGKFLPTGTTISYYYDCGNGYSVNVSLHASSLSHSYGDWVKEDDIYHAKTCAGCGDTQDGLHSFGDWIDTDTNHTHICTICNGAVEADHTYSTWTDNGDGTHIRTCSVCGSEDPVAHTYSTWKDNGDGTHIRTCSVCGNEDPVAHTYSTWTDNGDGTHIRTCTVCGSEDPVAHTYSTWKDNGDGTHIRTCSVCGSEDPVPHTYSTWKDNGDGTHIRTCSVCGSEEPVAHTYSTWTDNGDGTHVRSCTVCGCEDPVAHTYSTWTDNGDGTHVRSCTVCGCEDPVAHTYSTWKDNGDGTHIRTCSVCGSEDPVAHTYGTWTDNGDGTHIRSCTVCGSEDPVAHTYSTWKDNGDGTHIRSCTVCGSEDPVAHTYSTWTDNGDGTHIRSCTVCGSEDPGAHTYGGWEDSEDGTHVRTCTVCGSEEPGEHVYGGWEEAITNHYRTCELCGHEDPAEHVYGDTWTISDDGTHYRTCEDCGYQNYGVHQYGKYAANEDGTHTRTCTSCGAPDTQAHKFTGWTETSENTWTRTCVTCSHAETYTLGDVNSDGVINTFDLAIAKRGLLKNETDVLFLASADVNGDGSFTVLDIVMLQQFLLGKIKHFPG